MEENVPSPRGGPVVTALLIAQIALFSSRWIGSKTSCSTVYTYGFVENDFQKENANKSFDEFEESVGVA